MLPSHTGSQRCRRRRNSASAERSKCDDDARVQRKAPAEPFEKGISGRCVRIGCEPAPPGAAGNTGDQNRLETSPERSSALKSGS